MSSIKEYFKQEGLKEGIEIGIKKGIEQGREQGIEQGVEQGYKRGVEQGFKQGTERGIKQGTEKGVEQVALNMLKNGEPAEKVAFYTGLSIERIAFLQKQIMNEKQW